MSPVPSELLGQADALAGLARRAADSIRASSVERFGAAKDAHDSFASESRAARASLRAKDQRAAVCRALADAGDFLWRAADEARRFEAALPVFAEMAAELALACEALRAGARAAGVKRVPALVEAKKRAMEVERLRRAGRKAALADPRFVDGLKAKTLGDTLSAAAEAVHQAADALGALLVSDDAIAPRRKALALLLAALLLPAAARAAEPIRLTIFHTNDVHGWIMSRKSQREADAGRVVGGAAAFKSVVDKEKGPKLVLDAGDWFQGTPEGNLSQGQASIDVFNAVGYDAVEIGNHDFDFTEARLKQLVAGLKMPVLGANIYDEKTGKRVPYVTPWLVKDVGGVKVGLFGLLTTNMRNLTFPENYAGLRFRREADEAKDAVAALKKAGATVIVAVTHVGHESSDIGKFEGDETVAAEVPGIDVIIGGHTHSFIKDPQRDAKNGTLITQAGAYLPVAGRVDLELDPKTKKVVSSRGRLVQLYVDETGEDPAVAAVVKKHSDEVGKVYDVVIATSQAALLRNRDAESTIGDWMMDCERDWAKADVAIQNAGGIRADLPKGPITLRDIFNIMPFDNRVVNLTMDGRLVADVFDHGVDRTKGMIQVSGAAFLYDRDGAAGKRLENAMVGGRKLDPAASYKVATIDFLVKGGDGYTPFSRASKTEQTRELLRDVLRDCAAKQGLIPVPAGGRMTPEPSREPATVGGH